VPSLTEINTTLREYQLRDDLRAIYLLLAAVLLTGAGLVIKLATSANARPFGSYLLFAGVLLILLALFLVLVVLRSRLVLVGDWIEVHSGLRTFRANRNEIEGFRKMQNRGARWTQIYLKEGRGAFNISESFTGNNDLNEWLKGVPDLDQRDADQAWQQIRDQHPPGTTDDEIRNELRQAKAWAAGLSIASVIAGFIALLVNYQPLYTPSIVLLLIFPPLGFLMAHRFPLLFTCSGKSDPRAKLGFLVMWPGFPLAGYYLGPNDHARLANYSQLIPWALPVLVIFFVALFRATMQNPDRSVFVILFLSGAMYSFGVAAAANVLPDRTHPRLYRAYVLEKYETHGKSTIYHLRVASWGPIDNADDLVVPVRTYRQVRVRDLMCIELHPGFLHAPWYTVAPCSEQLAAP
jgi:hypothetical protein